MCPEIENTITCLFRISPNQHCLPFLCVPTSRLNLPPYPPPLLQDLMTHFVEEYSHAIINQVGVCVTWEGCFPWSGTAKGSCTCVQGVWVMWSCMTVCQLLSPCKLPHTFVGTFC